MKKITFTLAAALFATALAAQAGNITVKGSDTLVILAQKWAEVYMGKNSSTKIQVTGGGSGVGIADHATNNGEEVVYLYEGRDIRHTGKG